MYAQILNLPRPPSEIIDYVLDRLDTMQYDDQIRGIEVITLDGVYLRWMNEHVYSGIWISQSFDKDLKVHVDRTITISRFMYFIETGGKSVVTHFHGLDDRIIESHSYHNGDWVYMRTDIPHSVEHVSNRRICITAPVLRSHLTIPHTREMLY